MISRVQLLLALWEEERMEETPNWWRLTRRFLAYPRTTTLQAVLARLDHYHPLEIIFAKKPWTKDSLAIVAFELDEPTEPRPMPMPAKAERLGLDYLYEVDLAKELLDGWSSNLGRELSADERCGCIIDQATNDGWAQWNKQSVPEEGVGPGTGAA